MFLQFDAKGLWRRIVCFIAIIGIWLAFAGMTRAEPPNLPEYPRADGSTTTQPLQQAIMKKVMGLTEVNPKHTNTKTAYMRLINGEVDFILVSCSPSDDELGAARKKGLSFDVTQVALNALVFIVHRENPIQSVSLEQIRGVYTGSITSWADLGVSRLDEIAAYTRDRNSGSQELMEKLVMSGLKFSLGPAAGNESDKEVESMWLLAQTVARDERSLGYTLYHYATFIFPKLKRSVSPDVKIVSVEGVAPSDSTIASGRYPLTTGFFAVIRGDTPEDHPALKIRDWLLTAEGKDAISEAHYVPIP